MNLECDISRYIRNFRGSKVYNRQLSPVKTNSFSPRNIWLFIHISRLLFSSNTSNILFHLSSTHQTPSSPQIQSKQDLHTPQAQHAIQISPRTSQQPPRHLISGSCSNRFRQVAELGLCVLEPAVRRTNLPASAIRRGICFGYRSRPGARPTSPGTGHERRSRLRYYPRFVQP